MGERRRSGPGHLARRTLRSLRPGPPRRSDEEWARSLLTDPEIVLFSRMSNTDRRHAIGVARAARAGLEALDLDEPTRRAAIAAALLHDVGKTAAGLRTYGRVVATLSGAVGGRDYAEHWQDTRGFTRRVGLYLRYEQLGSDMLAVAGSHPLVVAWASEHHLDPTGWTVPLEIGRVLSAADR